MDTYYTDMLSGIKSSRVFKQDFFRWEFQEMQWTSKIGTMEERDEKIG